MPNVEHAISNMQCCKLDVKHATLNIWRQHELLLTSTSNFATRDFQGKKLRANELQLTCSFDFFL